jgi:phage terminase large subunit GpA-like protein
MVLNELNHEAIALHDICGGHAAFLPPRRVPVHQGAAEILYFKQPGGVPGLWNPLDTPYMIEPMDMLASRRHEAVCFVGPARTGKTAGLILGGMSHFVVNDPGDMLIIQMTQDKAREFSKTDIDRALRHSPRLNAMMSSSGQDDNTHDKMFRHGMWLRIAWPTVSNVSGSTYRYVLITDLDRIANAENVDGEGPLFQLALKRVQTFLSRGMCLAESSPGIELTDPNWRPATAHEAPPATGILGIYNRSDRRRWYWKCPACDEPFEAKPGLELFGLPSEDVLLEVVREANLELLANEHNRVVCPHCQGMIGPRAKQALNLAGRWVQDGQIWTRNNEMIGEAMESTIGGFWLGGVAAAYQSWRSIILRHLQGLRDYALTGSEETLKTTANTDQGVPYMSRLLLNAKLNAADPQSRKEDGLKRFMVPEEARCIVASVDVQGGTNARFVVQVHAIGPNLEQWPIDRYNITESNREGMGTEKAPIDPAVYPEDWDLITERVVRSTYRTHIEGREMRVMMTVVDTGGEHQEKNDGVTDKAYAWFRRLRRIGLAMRVTLVKGASQKTAPLIKEKLVGARNPKEKGDIPLYLINPNMLKDAVATGLKRTEPGPNYIHIPAWLPAAWFDELQAEVRNKDGTWMQVRKRNEAFDLCVYIRAGCLRLGLDKIKWDSPPKWALPVADNSECITTEDRRELQANTPVAQIPDEAQKQQPVLRTRRSSRSSYLG